MFLSYVRHRVHHIIYSLTYLLTYLLTHSMQQNPFWVANRFSASQEIPSILLNPKVYYRVHKYPSTVSILSGLQNASSSVMCKKTFYCYRSCLKYSPFPSDHTPEFLSASRDIHNWLPQRALGHGEQETWRRQEKRTAPLIITGLIKKGAFCRKQSLLTDKEIEAFKKNAVSKIVCFVTRQREIRLKEVRRIRLLLLMLWANCLNRG
jgi:hypothetical protein